MSMQKTVEYNFEIQVKTVYVSKESRPHENYHFFAYKISILNKGAHSAQLVSRHWIITDSLGGIEEVKGPGVVGIQPKIQPGQTFEYESACPLGTPTGSMKGSYNMLGESGENFQIEVPEFFLIAPNCLH
ncbi:MAG TPA: Co2+/Mg2+ efflux protein ApaG [Pseudobdellovibrionaceae bacterium]|nr:Co2+/Mg2+ efflux protein ApaG [Pseudobdellovibrionaceae bacterium]